MEDRLYKKLEAYGKSDFYPFHMPGHKRNPLAVEGDFPVERDITEIDGFDNLHHAEDILKRAQEDVARLYGVPESFYSINGSSGAILAAVSAAVDKGGQILVARNCHKAVYPCNLSAGAECHVYLSTRGSEIGDKRRDFTRPCGNVSGGKSGDPGGADHFADL